MAKGLRPGPAWPMDDIRQWSIWCREQANVQDSLDHTMLTNIGTNTHTVIDTHIADGTIHFTEASIDHLNILSIGTNSHAFIDTHIANNAIHMTGTVTVTTTSHTAAADHVILVDDDTAAALVTVTLPTSADGNQYHIKKLGSTAQVVIDGNASETIDGGLTATLTTPFESLTIVADGANWNIL